MWQSCSTSKTSEVSCLTSKKPFSRPAHVQEFVKVRDQLGRRCASGERADGEWLQERLELVAHEKK